MQEKLQNKSSIKERIIHFAENQSIKKKDFFDKIEMTSANFRGIGLKSSLNSSTIEIIITHYPAINLHWLITGEGTMINSINNDALNMHEIIDPILNYRESEIIIELKKIIAQLNEEKLVLYRIIEANILNQKTK